MKELGWKKVAALTEEGHKYADYISAVQDLVEKDGISFVVNRNIPNDAKLSMTQVLFHSSFSRVGGSRNNSGPRAETALGSAVDVTRNFYANDAGIDDSLCHAKLRLFRRLI